MIRTEAHRNEPQAPRQRRPRRKRLGFTLVEMLIALAIFAVVASVVYDQIGDVARQTVLLEQRTLGTWIARNELARLTLARRYEPDRPITNGLELTEVEMAGNSWRVETNITTTDTRDFYRVEVTVRLDDSSPEGIQAATVTSFLGKF